MVTAMQLASVNDGCSCQAAMHPVIRQVAAAGQLAPKAIQC